MCGELPAWVQGSVIGAGVFVALRLLEAAFPAQMAFVSNTFGVPFAIVYVIVFAGYLLYRKVNQPPSRP